MPMGRGFILNIDWDGKSQCQGYSVIALRAFGLFAKILLFYFRKTPVRSTIKIDPRGFGSYFKLPPCSSAIVLET